MPAAMPLFPRRIGLTGGIGSGKSTVARQLVGCGAALIDADAISRALTATGGAAIPAIREQFGASAIASDGALDRDVMRQLVFADPGARQQLEAIVHPLVARETRNQSEAAAAQGRACLVFDIPLLVESTRWRPQVDLVLVVDCREATQIERVLQREQGRTGWTREAVEKVIAGQASRQRRLAAADICLFNDGLSLDALEALVRQLSPRFGL
jgi:dephospho-CoA kinase